MQTPAHVMGTMNEVTVVLDGFRRDTNTPSLDAIGDNYNTNHGAVVVLVTIAEGAVTNNDPADVIAAGTGDDTLGGNAKATLTV